MQIVRAAICVLREEGKEEEEEKTEEKGKEEEKEEEHISEHRKNGYQETCWSIARVHVVAYYNYYLEAACGRR